MLGLVRAAIPLSMILPVLGWIVLCWKITKGDTLGFILAAIGTITWLTVWATVVKEMGWVS